MASNPTRDRIKHAIYSHLETMGIAYEQDGFWMPFGTGREVRMAMNRLFEIGNLKVLHASAVQRLLDAVIAKSYDLGVEQGRKMYQCDCPATADPS